MMTQVQGEGSGADPRARSASSAAPQGGRRRHCSPRAARQWCRITLVESSAIPTVGVGEATIPPIFDFLRNIGADEVEFIRRCQATFKLGIQFRDWLHRDHAYWHPFGNLGVTINQRPFHHYYCRNLAQGHGESLADLCPSVALAEDGKFAFPSPDGNWPGGAVAYALHFDAGLVAAFLREHAEAAGSNGSTGGSQGDARRRRKDRRGTVRRWRNLAAISTSTARVFEFAGGRSGMPASRTGSGCPATARSPLRPRRSARTLPSPPRSAGWQWRIRCSIARATAGLCQRLRLRCRCA